MKALTPKRVRDYCTGYVRAKVGGKNPERLINLCLTAGFPVWDVTWEDGVVYFSTSLTKYKEIRPLARRSRCVPKIVERCGLPFLLGKIRRRTWFVLVALVFGTALLYLSGSAWTIAVKGNETLPTDHIISLVHGEGLKPGVRKSNIDTSKIEHSLLTHFPDLSWAYVRIQGTAVTIEVVEKTKAEPASPGDIVAKIDGLVKSVLVLAGNPHAEPGKTVKKGDTLISGDKGAQPPLGARGTVLAEAWYEVYEEYPMRSLVSRRTGNKMEFWVLDVGGQEVWLTENRRSFDWYEIEDRITWDISLGGFHLTVVRRSLYEVEWEQKDISPEDAQAVAEKRIRESMERRLPNSVELVDWNCRVEIKYNSIIAVRGYFSILEDIGEMRPW